MRVLSAQEMGVVCGGKGAYRCPYFVKNVFGAARFGGKMACTSIWSKKMLMEYFMQRRGALPDVQQAAPINWREVGTQLAGATACYFLVDFTVDTFEIGMFNCTDA